MAFNTFATLINSDMNNNIGITLADYIDLIWEFIKFIKHTKNYQDNIDYFNQISTYILAVLPRLNVYEKNRALELYEKYRQNLAVSYLYLSKALFRSGYYLETEIAIDHAANLYKEISQVEKFYKDSIHVYINCRLIQARTLLLQRKNKKARAVLQQLESEIEQVTDKEKIDFLNNAFLFYTLVYIMHLMKKPNDDQTQGLIQCCVAFHRILQRKQYRSQEMIMQVVLLSNYMSRILLHHFSTMTVENKKAQFPWVMKLQELSNNAYDLLTNFTAHQLIDKETEDFRTIQQLTLPLTLTPTGELHAFVGLSSSDVAKYLRLLPDNNQVVQLLLQRSHCITAAESSNTDALIIAMNDLRSLLKKNHDDLTATYNIT
ncbi:MAG: hypothetical protein KDH94_08655, partial [Coxiellaceae bacterium]|nr:hypothetical protein [Coxiellaceae bacterium]